MAVSFLRTWVERFGAEKGTQPGGKTRCVPVSDPLPGHFSPHSFRVTTVTDLLEQNVPLEDVQYLAGHSDPRTTRIYDRRRRKVTRNIVERISI